MKRIRRLIRPFKYIVALFLVSLLWLAINPAQVYAEPQSQADCPAGTTFVPGSDKAAIIGDIGNLSNSQPPGPTPPNECVNTSTPRPTETITCPDGGTISGVTPGLPQKDKDLLCAGGIGKVGGTSNTPINLRADCKPPAGTSLNKDNCGIIAYIVLFTRTLAAIVGVVIVIMIAVGGLQFSMARDDPQAVAAAKNRIRNAVFALLAYLFGFAFLQWLVPGGIFL